MSSAFPSSSAIDHVEIESGSEKITLRFRSVVNPELVDGLVP